MWCGLARRDREKSGSRLERHDPCPRGRGWEGARAEHSGRCVGEKSLLSRARRAGHGSHRVRGKPRARSTRKRVWKVVREDGNKDHPKGCHPQKGGRFGESLGRGNPKEARCSCRGDTVGAGRETGRRPRGRGAWDFGSTGQRRGGREPGDRPPAGIGKSFEGERNTRGNVGESAQVGPSAGNRVNPMTGCGVQQTRETVCGGNRRSREERQGRNVFGCGNPEPRETESGRTRGCR